MSKTYLVSTYHAFKNAKKTRRLRKACGACTHRGGRSIFGSRYDSPAYQAALVALGDGADRDIRLIEGV